MERHRERGEGGRAGRRRGIKVDMGEGGGITEGEEESWSHTADRYTQRAPRVWAAG